MNLIQNARKFSFFIKLSNFFSSNLSRCYLRSREDTVRSVVNSLLDDSPSELADELVKGECLQLDDGSVDEETEDWEKWMPDPVDADPSKSRNFLLYFASNVKKFALRYNPSN